MLINNNLIDKLPLFIALPCASLNKESDHRILLDGIFKITETIIRFEVALLVSEIENDKKQLPPELANFIERPSLGQWIQIFRSLNNISIHDHEFRKQLYDFANSSVLVARNEKAHTLNFSTEKAKKKLDEISLDFVKIIEEIARRPIKVLADSVDISGIKVNLSKCSGDLGDIVFVGGARRSSRLSPLFTWAACGNTDNSNLEVKLVQCYSSSKRTGKHKQKLKIVYDCFDPECIIDTYIIEDTGDLFKKRFGLNVSCMGIARNESGKFIDVHVKHVLENLDGWVENLGQDDRFFLIHGSPGTGKSALLAYSAIRYREKYPDSQVVYHRFSPGTDWFSWKGFESSCKEQLKCPEKELKNNFENALFFLDGLDLIKKYDPDTYTKIKKLTAKGRWVVTASDKSDLPSDFEFKNQISPPLLSPLSIRAILANLQHDIADKIFRQDRDDLTEDKVINPFIAAVYSHSDLGNPRWLQLLCEDLESGRLNPYDFKTLPLGLEGYAENAQQSLDAQRKKKDRVIGRLAIELPYSRQMNTHWLSYCEQSYDELLNNPLPTRLGIRSQPVWPMDSVPALDSEKNSEWNVQPTVIGEEGNSGFDILAWYSPLHFDGADRYGIYLPCEGIVHLADELANLLTSTCKNLSKISLLNWATLILYLHEMGHAFIERLVFSMERHGESRCYEIAAQRYSGLMLMEEAICNTFVCGMHQTILKKSNNQELSLHSQELQKALISYMRQQPAGYRDFVEISVTPQRSSVFVQNCKALLKFVYEIDELQQNIGIEKLLSSANAVIWKDYDQCLENLEFVSADQEAIKSDFTESVFESMGQELFPWRIPVYILGFSGTRQNRQARAWDMRNAVRRSRNPEAFMMFKRENSKILLNSVIPPESVDGSFVLCNSKNIDFAMLPKEINGNLYCINNQITSFFNIYKHLTRIDGVADFSGNPIKECLLPLLKIKGLQKVRLVEDDDVKSDLYKAQCILNKYMNNKDILACQMDLIENKLKSFARLVPQGYKK